MNEKPGVEILFYGITENSVDIADKSLFLRHRNRIP